MAPKPPQMAVPRQRLQNEAKALRFRGAFLLVMLDASGGRLSGQRKMFARVVVVGANGAGKTWFATRLAQRTGGHVICKDALALTTGWHRRPAAQVQADLARAVAAERWVLEGGPSILTQPVLARATLVVWLDVSGRLRAWRILRRSFWYLGRVRPEHPPGNRDWPGVRQMRFLLRALVHGDQFARVIGDALADWDGPILRLSTAAEASAFINAACEGAECL